MKFIYYGLRITTTRYWLVGKNEGKLELKSLKAGQGRLRGKIEKGYKRFKFEIEWM